MLQVKEPTLLDKILAREAVVGICGLGYVGLPLALTFGEKGEYVNAKDGSVLLFLPQGDFLMGIDEKRGRNRNLIREGDAVRA